MKFFRKPLQRQKEQQYKNKINNTRAKARGIKDKNKMLSQRNPRLRRTDVVRNSFAGCISDAAKEFSRTPEMSFSEIVSQPGVLLQQAEGAVALEKLKGFADTHGSWHLNKQMDVVNSDMELINFASFAIGNFPDEVFAIHSDSIEPHRVHGIFAFPHEVESVLSKAMLSRFQIHFSSPIAHAKFVFSSGGLGSNPSLFSHLTELNLWKSGNSSLGLKTEVSLPRM